MRARTRIARRLRRDPTVAEHALLETADANRTAELARYGYRVIRFWNNDVIHNLSGVFEIIQRELVAG